MALPDHDSFEVVGAWELDRGDQYFGYDGWWHLNYDTVITSEWATPSMVENGLDPEDLSGSVWLWHRDGDRWAARKVITIPAEPADPRAAAAGPRAVRGGAAAGVGHRPVGG